MDNCSCCLDEVSGKVNHKASNEINNENHHEINKDAYLKWFQRPSDPSRNWSFTEEGTACIKAALGNMDGFKTKMETACDVGLPEEEDVILLSIRSPILFSYLKDVSENEAMFPNTSESKLIFDILDNVVMKITDELKRKAKLFLDCTAIRVGSSAEGLKSGDPNEFDYNIILPQLSKYVNLEHRLNNNSVSDCINLNFFPDILAGDIALEEDTIYFKVEQSSEIIGDILPEMIDMTMDEMREFGQLKERALCLDDDARSWNNSLATFAPNPDRSAIKSLFKELEKIIEDTLKKCLVPELKLMPKKSVRDYRLVNQIALTSSLLWSGTEFKDLNINIDFAFLIPMKKQPLYYDFPKYLQASRQYTLPHIPLADADKITNYVMRSYKSCRLSQGIGEVGLLNQFSSNSVVKQSIRVCKKLRDLLMTHYFDIATETVCPVLQSYWIKTVAMYVFKLHQETDWLMKEDDVHLNQYVTKIFTMLHKCLTGDEGKTLPVLYSFNVPFKNLLNSFPRIDTEVNASYLDELTDEEKEILLRPNVVAANDIKHLLEVFTSFYFDGEKALNDIKEMKRKNDEEKSLIYEEGMREKLGLLLYQHFEVEDSLDLSPDYIEFVKNNFPNIEIRTLEEEEEIDYCGITTAVPIELINEDGEALDLEEMFMKAWNKSNFFGLDVTLHLQSDHARDMGL